MARKNTLKNLSSESTESTESLSLPRTPQRDSHNRLTLLDNILSSPPQHHLTPLELPNKLLKTGIQVTPNKLSRALTKILAEKPIPKNSYKQAAMNNLIERLSSLGSKHHIHHTLEQPRSKRVKIEAAPDGSAALVIESTQSNQHSSQHHHYYYQTHHHNQQLPHPTTVAPASLFSSSPSSSSSFNNSMRLSSVQINQHSPLVSATTPEYGRVIMKKEALINKLGFQAAQRAIRRANSQRKPHTRVNRSSNHPSSSSASSPPSSPQTWRTGTIGKWLESADEEDEDEGQHYRHSPRARDLTLSKLAKESRPSGSAAHRPTNLQSLFWSPVKTKKSPSCTRRPLRHSDSLLSSHDDDDHHQKLMDRLGRMDALGMGSDTIRWPINRPITPPNQRSFFHSDDFSHYQLPRPGGSQDRPDLYGPFSQLSFGSHSSPGGPSLQGMLKPGCNLNQAFLVLAPSPKTQLSESNDENRRPETAAPPSTTAKLDRQARSDYSPCSPLRSDWRKLMEQHHFSARLESPNPSQLRALPKPSPASPEMVDQRWLAGLDSNRLPNPPSSPPLLDDGLLNLDHFPSSKSNDPLDDLLSFF